MVDAIRTGDGDAAAAEGGPPPVHVPAETYWGRWLTQTSRISFQQRSVSSA